MFLQPLNKNRLCISWTYVNCTVICNTVLKLVSISTYVSYQS